MAGHTQLQPLIRKARKAGWIVTITGKCHYRWQAPDGGLYFSAGTPSDRRTLRNIEAALTRMGLKR